MCQCRQDGSICGYCDTACNEMESTDIRGQRGFQNTWDRAYQRRWNQWDEVVPESGIHSDLHLQHDSVWVCHGFDTSAGYTYSREWQVAITSTIKRPTSTSLSHGGISTLSCNMMPNTMSSCAQCTASRYHHYYGDNDTCSSWLTQRHGCRRRFESYG